MGSPHEFWVCLRNLASIYEAEGMTPDERVANVVDQFRNLPHLAQRELLDDLFRIVMDSPEIYTLARKFATASGEAQRRQKVG